jgi:hypothetical protein
MKRQRRRFVLMMLSISLAGFVREQSSITNSNCGGGRPTTDLVSLASNPQTKVRQGVLYVSNITNLAGGDFRFRYGHLRSDGADSIQDIADAAGRSAVASSYPFGTRGKTLSGFGLTGTRPRGEI